MRPKKELTKKNLVNSFPRWQKQGLTKKNLVKPSFPRWLKQWQSMVPKKEMTVLPKTELTKKNLGNSVFPRWLKWTWKARAS